MNDMEKVDLVDKLMICFRNNIKPTDKDLLLAYKAGINVKELERYIKEYEIETEDKY